MHVYMAMIISDLHNDDHIASHYLDSCEKVLPSLPKGRRREARFQNGSAACNSLIQVWAESRAFGTGFVFEERDEFFHCQLERSSLLQPADYALQASHRHSGN